MEISHHIERCIVRWSGDISDYEPINTFLDSSRLYLSDWRHRVLLHSTIGVFFVEELFPKVFTNTNGRLVTSKTIAEKHIIEDLGIIPTPKWILRDLPPRLLKIDFDNLDFLTTPELRFIQKVELLAKTKSYVYYSDLGLDIFVRRFGVHRYESGLKGFKVITQSATLLNVADILIHLPIHRWLAGLNSIQLKNLNHGT